MCSECSVSLTLHRGGTLAVCHYCGLGRPTPESYETCSGEYLRQRGYGTERIEVVTKELFPESRVARMDRDTMRKKGSYETLLTRFAARELDTLVGTQMLAKGHDFPAVTLVGVLAADIGLGAPDFRAAERTFQLLTQVAGRAGRGELPGEVFIQTYTPEHYSLEFARAQDFRGFYESERRFRRGLRYPPVVNLINVIFEAEAMPGGHTKRTPGCELSERSPAQRRRRSRPCVCGPLQSGRSLSMSDSDQTAASPACPRSQLPARRSGGCRVRSNDVRRRRPTLPLLSSLCLSPLGRGRYAKRGG